MNDRLKELQAGAAAPEEVSITIDGEGTNINSPAPRENAKYMSEFFSAVEIVKQNIVVIRESTKRIGDINQQVALATTGERESELSQEVQPLISATNKKASIVKQLLQRLKEETDVLATSTETKQSDLRIRNNLVTTLTRKFVDVMKEYTNAQQKFKTDIKKKVKRQVQIVKPDATTEEIDAVMKGGGGSSDVFKSAILKGSASDAIQNAYMNVADKYQDVLTLEASVRELHQMFVDFALLTEQQGELLDQIEYQVKAASDYIDDANVELVQSIEYQKQIRKRQCIIMIILLVVIGVIVLIVLGVSGNLK